MADNLDINNQPFDAEQLAMLNVLADHIIPKDDSRNMPSAADVPYLDSLVSELEYYIPQLKAELLELNEHSAPALFVDLDRDTQQRVLKELSESQPNYLQRFAIHIYSRYYHDPRVLANIGLEARAPYPKGYTEYVKRGDLSLLDPVRARGPIYRPSE